MDNAIVPVEQDKVRRLVLRTVVIDRSSSIEQYENTEPVMEGYNAAIRQLQTLPGSFLVSCWSFGDNSPQKIQGFVTPDEAVLLTRESYQPSGGTPLFATFIEVLEYVEKKRVYYQGFTNVPICTYTTFLSDGDDSSSRYRFNEARHAVETSLRFTFNAIEALVVQGGVNAHAVFRNLGIPEGFIRDITARDIKSTMSTSSKWTSGMSVSGLRLADLMRQEQDKNNTD